MAQRQQASRRIPLGNSWQVEYDLTQDGVELDVGTVVAAYLSATPAGLAINPAVQVNLARQANPRTWCGVIGGAAVTTHLATRVGQKVWEIVTITGVLKSARWLIVEEAREI